MWGIRPVNCLGVLGLAAFWYFGYRWILRRRRRNSLSDRVCRIIAEVEAERNLRRERGAHEKWTRESERRWEHAIRQAVATAAAAALETSVPPVLGLETSNGPGACGSASREERPSSSPSPEPEDSFEAWLETADFVESASALRDIRRCAARARDHARESRRTGSPTSELAVQATDGLLRGLEEVLREQLEERLSRRSLPGPERRDVLAETADEGGDDDADDDGLRLNR
ncbi:t40 [Tupaiid betaherpesvirus 1]|uniref:T40 n=1 Tax=Tupaiid herpesvirus 1 (strain 1) TaxID=10397 RepID=Q91TQ3_TUHV1|nr:t40 [Tupaiid betaherpesvirus 1]AAK57084.1 t40 [Tupaiid betaherpesvirus 1]